jgi:hypothetical protein
LKKLGAALMRKEGFLDAGTGTCIRHLLRRTRVRQQAHGHLKKIERHIKFFKCPCWFSQLVFFPVPLFAKACFRNGLAFLFLLF